MKLTIDEALTRGGTGQGAKALPIKPGIMDLHASGREAQRGHVAAKRCGYGKDRRCILRCRAHLA